MLVKVLTLLFFLTLLSGTAVAERIDDKDILHEASKLTELDPYLILAMVKIESSNHSHKKILEKNGRYSTGLLQLQKGTAKMMGFVGKSSKLLNWKTNLKYGIKYIEYQLERYKNKKKNLEYALAAYNAGTAFICRTGRTKSGKKCRIGKFVNQDYVDKVTSEYGKLCFNHVRIIFPIN